MDGKSKAVSILVLSGPNLNLLGKRQPEIYGHTTLAEIETLCAATAASMNAQLGFRQSNLEGELIDWVQQAAAEHQAIVINPGAYAHTSIALMDALLACGLPVYEVHITNIHRREEFRHTSYAARAARGVICGFGPEGYSLAVRAAIGFLKN